MVERSTYSLLELLGDVGGLFDALYILSSLMVRPLAHATMKIFLLNLTYRQVSEDSSSKAMEIETGFFPCWSFQRDKWRNRMMKRSYGEIQRQLDLVKLIKRQRMLVLAVMAMMSAKQRRMIDYLSAMIVRVNEDGSHNEQQFGSEISSEEEDQHFEDEADLLESLGERIKKGFDLRLAALVNARVKQKTMKWKPTKPIWWSWGPPKNLVKTVKTQADSERKQIVEHPNHHREDLSQSEIDIVLAKELLGISFSDQSEDRKSAKM